MGASTSPDSGRHDGWGRAGPGSAHRPQVGKTLTGHGLGVCSLTTVAYEGGLLAVSSCEEGVLLAWDLTTGTRVADLEGSYNGGLGAALVDGRPVAATGGHDSFVQAWDLLSGEPLGESLTGIEPVVGALAVTEVNGRAVVVAGGDDDNALHVGDLAGRKPTGSPPTGHTDGIRTLGTTTVAGRTIAVTGSDDGTTRGGDLARHEQIGEPFTGHRLRKVTEMAGAPVAVTVGPDKDLQVWDLTRAARAPTGVPPSTCRNPGSPSAPARPRDVRDGESGTRGAAHRRAPA
ncbi:WD40 repeat domain-containing protein [Streptomyces sp. NPDC053427]|uniref:WD40 repeat domain-containing protein n=1 Tax=Streptomyces sp. NPDC053427 TaxID=3365701 RepID=UPI0037CD8F6C